MKPPEMCYCVHMGVWDFIYGFLVLSLASGILLTMPMTAALRRYRREKKRRGREPTEAELCSPEEAEAKPPEAPKPKKAKA